MAGNLSTTSPSSQYSTREANLASKAESWCRKFGLQVTLFAFLSGMDLRTRYGQPFLSRLQGEGCAESDREPGGACGIVGDEGIHKVITASSRKQALKQAWTAASAGLTPFS